MHVNGILFRVENVIFRNAFRGNEISICIAMFLERCRGRVVRDARLWCRKSSERCEIEPKVSPSIRRLENSVCQPSSKWVPF